MREWKQVEDKPQGLLYLEQSSKAFLDLSLPILTNHDSQNKNRKCIRILLNATNCFCFILVFSSLSGSHYSIWLYQTKQSQVKYKQLAMQISWQQQ